MVTRTAALFSHFVLFPPIQFTSINLTHHAHLFFSLFYPFWFRFPSPHLHLAALLAGFFNISLCFYSSFLAEKMLHRSTSSPTRMLGWKVFGKILLLGFLFVVFPIFVLGSHSMLRYHKAWIMLIYNFIAVSHQDFYVFRFVLKHTHNYALCAFTLSVSRPLNSIIQWFMISFFLFSLKHPLAHLDAEKKKKKKKQKAWAYATFDGSSLFGLKKLVVWGPLQVTNSCDSSY